VRFVKHHKSSLIFCLKTCHTCVPKHFGAQAQITQMNTDRLLKKPFASKKLMTPIAASLPYPTQSDPVQSFMGLLEFLFLMLASVVICDICGSMEYFGAQAQITQMSTDRLLRNLCFKKVDDTDCSFAALPDAVGICAIFYPTAGILFCMLASVVICDILWQKHLDWIYSSVKKQIAGIQACLGRN
jgi:hypothetical protein